MMRCAFALVVAAATSLPAQQPIAITHVDVVDARDSSARRDQTVIVLGNRIVASANAGAVRVPRNARVIDGRGKFLIPGLWDMHVHTVTVSGRHLLGLYVANGVTGVRDMASEWATISSWRKEIASGALAGPRIVASGPYIEGGDVPIAHVLARNPDEARVAVDSLISLGVDFIKVHGRLTPATYFAVAQRARERRIAFAGHVSQGVGSAAASDSGQRSIEHLLAIPMPCTPAESIALAPRYPLQGALGRCSSDDLSPLYARFVRNGTWVTPTFAALVEISEWPRRLVPGDSLARYVPDSVHALVAKLLPTPGGIPAGAESTGRAVLAKRMAQVATMRRAGVRVLTGTDAPMRNSPPGFGLHEELLLMTRGGMSNFDALRAATSEPALYFEIDSLGTVEAGKLADLVLLDANPLDDIRNTRRISAVFANGRLFRGEERLRLLTVPGRR